jgi:hypothetical protein
MTKDNNRKKDADYIMKTDSGSYHSGKIYIQGYYKLNKQIQHFMKPKLFKISTLTMHNVVEKL